jgi:Zn-dependent protease with chaperone function
MPPVTARPISSASIFHGEATMITADYFDGISARRHTVSLDVSGARVAIDGAGIAHSYAQGDVVLAEPCADAPALLYVPGGGHCEVPAAGRAALFSAFGYRPSAVRRWQRHWPAALASVVLLVLLLAATVIWGIPAAAERVAQALPEAVDMSLGRTIFSAMEKAGVTRQSRLSDERIAEVEAIWRTVLPRHPRIPLRLVIRDMPTIGVNAFALPDGTVLVSDWMVRQALEDKAEFGPTQTAAMAGVLAHEIGHIQHRDSTRALARSSLTAALSATLFGDFSAVAAGAPAVLLGARHSRDMETAADTYALEALQSRHMPLAPLADLLDTMAGEHDQVEDAVPGWLATAGGYLSSHPGGAQRAERLRAADSH